MEDNLNQLEKEIIDALNNAHTADALEELRIKYIGRKGALTEILKNIKNVPSQDRPRVGERVNALKRALEDKVKEKLEALGAARGESKEQIDLSLPGSRYEIGTRHPLTQIIDEICDIFLGFGFRIVETPEIETDYYNFTGLNIPDDHPSREDFHTFFLDLAPEKHEKRGKEYKMLLRSQTSTGQIRVMEKEKPPFQVIIPGRVYRPDATDASHSFMFHQVEGFMVDRNIKFSDLKGVLDLFCKSMFGKNVKTRFRPHYFPFTEPSAEVDVSCIICGGSGCSVCGRKGWLEILGAGMINPKVLEGVGISPEEWTGFAFGMGVERIAMLKWGINDIRIFYENDLRFLKQF